MITIDQEKEIQRLCNRHMAQCLDDLKEINTANVVIETIKRKFNHLQSDLKVNLQELGNEGTNKDYNH